MYTNLAAAETFPHLRSFRFPLIQCSGTITSRTGECPPHTGPFKKNHLPLELSFPVGFKFNLRYCNQPLSKKNPVFLDYDYDNPEDIIEFENRKEHFV